jgi:radical SAM superfamily enzyme YgiQ (UPF0313 family)
VKIAIIDIDSTKMPNLALHKISKYYKDAGDDVEWNPLRMWTALADKIYVSCIFKENYSEAVEWEGQAEIGGSGYSLTKQLPPEIEAVRPRISLGFTTRGCIRRCPFCIVPQKEGRFRLVGDLYDLWDWKSEDVIILDNNILADANHFVYICKQSLYPQIRLDFSQGLDHRLLTPEICSWLKKIKHKQCKFAWDSPDDIDSVDKAIKMLAKADIKQSRWYCLVGFDTTFEQDLMRLNYLREHGQRAFTMRYKNTAGNMLLARWSNQPSVFYSMNFQQFLAVPRNVNYYKKYYDEISQYMDPGQPYMDRFH